MRIIWCRIENSTIPPNYSSDRLCWTEWNNSILWKNFSQDLAKLKIGWKVFENLGNWYIYSFSFTNHWEPMSCCYFCLKTWKTNKFDFEIDFEIWLRNCRSLEKSFIAVTRQTTTTHTRMATPSIQAEPCSSSMSGGFGCDTLLSNEISNYLRVEKLYWTIFICTNCVKKIKVLDKVDIVEIFEFVSGMWGAKELLNRSADEPCSCLFSLCLDS